MSEPGLPDTDTCKDQLRKVRDEVDWDTVEAGLDKWARNAEGWEILADRICSPSGQTAFSEHWEGEAAASATRAFQKLAATVRQHAATMRSAATQARPGVQVLREVADAAKQLDGTTFGEIVTLGFGGPDEGKIARENYERLLRELPPVRDGLGQVAQASGASPLDRKRDSGLAPSAMKLPGGGPGGPGPDSAPLGGPGGSASPLQSSLVPGGGGGHTPSAPPQHTPWSPSTTDPFGGGVTADGAVTGYTGAPAASGPGYTIDPVTGVRTPGSSAAGLLGGSAAALGGVGGGMAGALGLARAGGSQSGGVSGVIGGAPPGGAAGTGGAASSGAAGAGARGAGIGMMGGMGGGGAAGSGSGAGQGARYGPAPQLSPRERRRGRPKHDVLGAGSRRSPDEPSGAPAPRRRPRPADEDDDPFFDNA